MLHVAYISTCAHLFSQLGYRPARAVCRAAVCQPARPGAESCRSQAPSQKVTNRNKSGLSLIWKSFVKIIHFCGVPEGPGPACSQCAKPNRGLLDPTSMRRSGHCGRFAADSPSSGPRLHNTMISGKMSAYYWSTGRCAPSQRSCTRRAACNNVSGSSPQNCTAKGRSSGQV